MSVTEIRNAARALNAGRIGEHRILEAGSLQLRHARIGERDHLVLRAELQAAGRTGLDARRLESDLDAVDAQRALRHFAGALTEFRHVERAAGRTISAADAVVRVDVDDAVGVLHDRARRGAGLATAARPTVHPLVLAH